MKTAVSRNKVKRTIRESFRTHTDILSGLDIVVLAQQQITPDEGRTNEPVSQYTLATDSAMRAIAWITGTIRSYQRFVSPFLGVNCRLLPVMFQLCL